MRVDVVRIDTDTDTVGRTSDSISHSQAEFLLDLPMGT